MRSERGFTLIELLVVIAILAVLFGATALALAGVGDGAETASASGELDVVQTALDVCDALSTCSFSAVTTATQAGPTTVEVGSYLRRVTKFFYEWDATGAITQQCSNAACSGTNDPLFP